MLRTIDGRTPDGRLRLYFVDAADEGCQGPLTGQASAGAELARGPLAVESGLRERRRDVLHPGTAFLTTGRQGRPVADRADRCPLCPSVDGQEDGFHEAPWDGYRVAVFANRYPALGPGAALPETEALPAGTERSEAGGSAEMVLYTPCHGGDLGKLSAAQVADVVRVWAQRTKALYQGPDIAYVYVFENRGREVGATLAHPHGQIYALPSVPPRIEALAAREDAVLGEACCVRPLPSGSGAAECAVCAYGTDEVRLKVRLVDREDAAGTGPDGSSGGFLALCPFAPRFPYEVQLLPTRCVDRLDHLTESEIDALGALLGRTVRRLDGVFGGQMPYMMSVLQGGREDGQGRFGRTLRHLRIGFAPLRRSADRLKVLAASETGLDVYLTDVLPERAAAELRTALAAQKGTGP